MSCFYRRKNGFTLVELMIVIAIIGILATIAYPSYQNSVMKTHRAEGTTALIDLQSRMERYFMDRHSYVGAHIGGTADGTQLLANDLTENDWYKLQITAQTVTTFTIQAVPQGSQVNDASCVNLILQSDGTRNISGTGNAQDCW